MEKLYYTADEVAEMVGVGRTTAYGIVKKLNKELKELSGNQEKKESVGNFYVDMVCGLRREETKKGIKQHIKDLFSNEEKEN